jgi:hypothetical protein
MLAQGLGQDEGMLRSWGGSYFLHLRPSLVLMDLQTGESLRAPPVEQLDLGTVLRPQDMEQVMGLRRGQKGTLAHLPRRILGDEAAKKGGHGFL